MWRRWKLDRSSGALRPVIYLGATVLLCALSLSPLRAEESLHDDNLPSVTSQELHQLSDDRLRQKIMQDSIEVYHGACSCPYQVRPNGHSCRGHIHILKDHHPICYPRDVTADMLADWRRTH